ncbi:hypothetical protein COLSTE_01699 [Collinsella stercoris DSM 13279]|uniref:Uncharacterized protein n=1 Tax=Collinsella stercoris DSM 13279 TaxID=445975 RepID=B6GC80_9ACTN|nr:hypothetical protein COLSTE_01699 [Collinsella stercoris DSM 13279]
MLCAVMSCLVGMLKPGLLDGSRLLSSGRYEWLACLEGTGNERVERIGIWGI